MCGIFGIIDKTGSSPPDPLEVDRLTDLMTHRGPDGRGSWTDGGVGLGHRRLAIIDIERSQQPMWSSDRRHVLVYNGELYNFRELRAELEAKGVHFRTRGDTEVVVEAISYWGVKAITRFNGMFAFAIWDCERHRMLLARDRLGIKPLFYADDVESFAFASEFPPLLELSWVDKSPNPLAVAAYLGHYQLTFKGHTVYKGINSLDPGCYLTWDRDGLHLERYWELPKLNSDSKSEIWTDARIPEATQLVAAQMRSAVKSHMVADVPVGAFLSGGIDSAVVTSLMAETSTDQVKAYSIGFDNPGYNEFDYSIPLVKKLDLQHELIRMGEDDYLEIMLDLIRHKQAPLSTPNEVPIQILSRQLSREITVVLSGEGADELMGGYPPLLRSPHDFQAAQLLRENPGSMTSTERSSLRAALRKQYGRTGFNDLTDHFLSVYSWLSIEDRRDILNPEFISDDVLNEINQYWRDRLASLNGLSDYDRYLYLLLTEHLQGLLMRLDTQTMSASVEARVPFCDNDLVDLVWSLPFEYKLRWKNGATSDRRDHQMSLETAETQDTAKYILKEAFRSEIPSEIIQRRKKAFPVPLDSIISMKRIDDLIADFRSNPLLSQYFNVSNLHQWVEKSLQQPQGELKVWMLLSLGYWLLD